jgi:CyaY protein
MNESDFHKLADKEISFIFEKIEEHDKDYILETDLLNEILYITLPTGGQYVINKHTASRQIWMSSPKSSAHHFSYILDKDIWISSIGNKLREMLEEELQIINLKLN